MEGLAATSLAGRYSFSGCQSLVDSPLRRQFGPTRNVAVSAGREMDGRDYNGRLVDENMIVLRVRIREMKMSEPGFEFPPEWTEWEKKFYEHYNMHVCEAVGFLQSVLMNTRPGLAIGVMALMAMSVPVSIVALVSLAFGLP
ncbi:hypothetical protein NMG60_11006127 [Bertholletia excelsa]